MEKVRVALIGVGAMGKKYAQMLVNGNVADMTLTAIVCRNEAATEWAKGLGEGFKIYKSAEELYANSSEYDAVIIATPHKTHEELAVKAFNLGKSVLCDKPAGASISQAIHMSEAAKEADKIYGMVFHQRLYPKHQRLKEVIESGTLGEIKRVMLVNSRFLRTNFYHQSGSWRSSWNGEGGGALINQGQHILDLWQWLFGMPEKIYADIPYGKYNNFAVDDEATIHMTYPNGMTAVFMLTTGEAVWQERLEVVGTKGKILLEDDTLHIWKYEQDVQEYINTAKVNSREQMVVCGSKEEFEKGPEPYEELLTRFAKSVLTDSEEPLVAKGKDAIYPLMLTNAAYLSAWKGEVVSLPIDVCEYDQYLKLACEKEK